MTNRKAISAADVILGLAVAGALVVAVVLALRMDVFGDRPEGAPGADPAEPAAEEPVPAEIDPAMIKYRPARSIDVPLDEVRGLAVGPDDSIYVAGDRAILVFDPEGNQQRRIEVEHEPHCLAVAGADDASPGTIYSAARDRVVKLAPDGSVAGEWPGLGNQALITSIAAAYDNVFVADAGNKIVLRHDTSGDLVNRIGQRDPKRNVPGFAITSQTFDLAVSPDGLLRVINPRRLRIEAYTFDGYLEAHFGRGGTGVEAFFGCCNPTHLTVFDDGRFVTAEKGAARVKVYTAEGDFDCVVAEPEQLQLRNSHAIGDLAVDRRGRVLVLDSSGRMVRIFEPVDEEEKGTN
jgi:WD40 repeat protein